jgi:hypothetical protein
LKQLIIKKTKFVVSPYNMGMGMPKVSMGMMMPGANEIVDFSFLMIENHDHDHQ